MTNRVDDFFKLNGLCQDFDQDRMISQIETSRHIVNVVYRPDNFILKKVSDIKFENVSFSKTKIKNTNFKNCTFENCLFIGSEFEDVEFHGCNFVNCNFFKSKFKNIYGKPGQFRKAILNNSHANIAVHLYQQLRENYQSEAQREFKNEVEYQFSVWKRRLMINEGVRNNEPPYKYLSSYLLSFVYGLLLGYGYRLRNLFITTFFMVSIATYLNHKYSSYMFVGDENPSIIKSIYFTVTTMATLGASGFSDLSEIGYAFVTFNVLIGISLLTATLNSLFRKVLR